MGLMFREFKTYAMVFILSSLRWVGNVGMNFVELSLDLNISIEFLIVKLKVEFLIAMHRKSFA